MTKILLKCSNEHHRLKYTMIFIKIYRNYLQIILPKYWNFYVILDLFIYSVSTTVMRMCLFVMQARSLCKNLIFLFLGWNYRF